MSTIEKLKKDEIVTEDDIIQKLNEVIEYINSNNRQLERNKQVGILKLLNRRNF